MSNYLSGKKRDNTIIDTNGRNTNQIQLFENTQMNYNS